MALNKDFRVKDSLYTGTSALFAAGGTSYDSTKVAIDTYGMILSGGRDLSLFISDNDNDKYDSVYNTVNANSADWGYQGTDIKDLTGSWESTFTTVNANSGKYESVYSSFSAASANIIDGVAEGDSQGQISYTTLDGTTVQVDVNGLQTDDSPAFYGVTAGDIRIGISDDNTIDTLSGDLTINSAGGLTTIDDSVVVTGDTTIQGSLSVVGSFTYLDTTVNVTSALEIVNNGTGPALTVEQTGNQPIANFKDDGVSVLFIDDGGNIGIGTDSPDVKLTIAGSLSSSGDIAVDGGLDIGAIVKQYDIPGSSTYRQDQIFTGTLTLAGSPNTVATFDKSGLETAKYIISLYNSGSRTACEVLVVYNGTSAYGTVYGLVDAQGTSLLSDIDVSVSGATLDLAISVSADCSVTIHGSAHY